jgi:hypothetical protein
MYFGKTSKRDPYTYNGSGLIWKRHIKKHGDDIETLWAEEFEDENLLEEFAMLFSEFHDIVNSTKWANLIIENGKDGWVIGQTRSYDTKVKMSISAKNRKPMSIETRQKLSESNKGHNRKHNQETKDKLSKANLGKVLSEETRKRMSESRMGSKRGSYKKKNQEL